MYRFMLLQYPAWMFETQSSYGFHHQEDGCVLREQPQGLRFAHNANQL